MFDFTEYIYRSVFNIDNSHSLHKGFHFTVCTLVFDFTVYILVYSFTCIKAPSNGPILLFTMIQTRTFCVFSGCAFLTYCGRESALRAQAALHEQKTLPGVSHTVCTSLSLSRIALYLYTK